MVMFACIHSPQKDCAALLMDCAYGVSPLVEATAEDTVTLDIEGSAVVFGSAAAVANAISHRATDLGLTANIAVAGNPDAANHVARCFSGITIIPNGGEAKRLSRLPIEALNFELADVDADRAAEIFETLSLWGIRSLGDFAKLPVSGISERLGAEGVRLQKLARGKSQRTLFLAQFAPAFQKTIDLDDPVELLEPLSFIFARVLNELCASLQGHGLAANELKLRLSLEDRSEHERSIRLPFPMRDGKVFLKLLLLDIQSHPPSCPIVAVTLGCEPAKPRSLQSGLFQPIAPEPEKLELVLARLARLVGRDNVGSPELIDTHRPGAFRLKRFGLRKFRESLARSKRVRLSLNKSDENKWASQSEIRNLKSLLGFRVFRPPLSAKVESLGGLPAKIKAKGGSRSVRGKIVRLAGPWRTTGDWWSEEGWARDEWDVTISSSGSLRDDATLYRIYHDLWNDGWFIEGVYD